MKIFKIFVVLIVSLVSNIFLQANLLALEKETHYFLNEKIVIGTNLNNYLKTNLGLPEGIEEKLNGKWALEWIKEGGKYEDVPYWFMPYLRSVNHFHNPLTDQGYRGVWGPFTLAGWSAVQWAQKPVAEQSPGGHYSWHDVRRYYYWALTSTDLNSRDTFFAETFRGLGQLMHLVQDMSVPAHVRDDGHLFYNYEKWVGKNHDILNFNPIFFDPSILTLPPNPLAPIPIAKIFDTDKYTSANPDPIITTDSKAIGIAEYTNANFLSEDTIFKDFPYPKYSSQSYDVYAKYHSSMKKRIYLRKKGDGEKIEHFATAGPFYNYLSFDPVLQKNALKLDNAVYSDYAKLLIPRAVGYSAGLLNYFFRGEMAAAALPVFYNNNSIGHVKVKIKNITPTQESMSSGYFVLMYRYTPTDATADGSGDVFGYASNAPPVSTLLYGNESDVVFDIYPKIIPIENYSSLKFMLVFKGTLGSEEGAIIGKHLMQGEVKFNEEWDNGLTGNHTWAHTGYNYFPSQGYGNGVTTNVIENGVLIKENIKNIGFNSSLISIDYQSYKDILPIPITPDTYLQFKINDIHINEIPPALPGHTAHWQGIWLRFNNNMRMQISTDQFVSYGSSTCYISFDPNYIIVGNFYRMFTELCGMSVPQQLQLEEIDFYQQISSARDNKQYLQRMEIDFIRIIDMKPMQ